MRIQADTWDELKRLISDHEDAGGSVYSYGQWGDGTAWADLSDPNDHPAISAAAVELRRLGVSYETAKPILRRVFNAGKGER